MKKFMIATDLDRTLVPNGNHKLSNGAMNSFKKLFGNSKNNLVLVFVTGRNKSLILDAVKRYDLPKPDYCISMVGSVIYRLEKGKLVEDVSWRDYLSKSKFDFEKVFSSLKRLNLELQPKKYLNDFKISYYLRGRFNEGEVLRKIKSSLKKSGIDAGVVCSFDVNRKLGLIDVMHPKANKLFALKFLSKKLGVKISDIVYCGDSGNDFEIIKSGVRSVLVKNASDDFRKRVEDERKKNKKMKIYFAEGDFEDFNGNYVSGILEGLDYWGMR